MPNEFISARRYSPHRKMSESRSKDRRLQFMRGDLSRKPTVQLPVIRSPRRMRRKARRKLPYLAWASSPTVRQPGPAGVMNIAPDNAAHCSTVECSLKR